MKAKQVIGLFILVVGLAGCSAHSPLIVKNTTDVDHRSTAKYAPHTHRVFVTSENLPESAKYEVLGQLEVGRIWYGSSRNILKSLADGARELGADAVVGVSTWYQPSGFSWHAPHGSGMAVKITESASVKLDDLKGSWQ